MLTLREVSRSGSVVGSLSVVFLLQEELWD